MAGDVLFFVDVQPGNLGRLPIAIDDVADGEEPGLRVDSQFRRLLVPDHRFADPVALGEASADLVQDGIVLLHDRRGCGEVPQGRLSEVEERLLGARSAANNKTADNKSAGNATEYWQPSWQRFIPSFT